MKKLFVILTLASIATSCSTTQQTTEKMHSMKCDTVVAKLLAGMSLEELKKSGANSIISYHLDKHDATKMSVTLYSDGSVEVFCYKCKGTNRLAFSYKKGHYWTYYKKGQKKALQGAINEFLAI